MYNGERHATPHQRRTLDRVQRCQRYRHWRPRLRRLRARHRARHLETLRLTPFDCGPYGRFAIPCWIVYRESRYLWHAANPASTAVGPYQMLDIHGRPWPIRTRADRLAHHRIAARLWAGGAGCSHWSAC